MDWEEMYDILRDYVGVNEDALDLAFGIAGCSEDTACAILNYYTGWKTFEGLKTRKMIKSSSSFFGAPGRAQNF